MKLCIYLLFKLWHMFIFGESYKKQKIYFLYLMKLNTCIAFVSYLNQISGFNQNKNKSVDCWSAC